MQKVVIVRSMNQPPEYEISERLESEFTGWRIISASTSLLSFGEMDTEHFRGVARHMYYVTTLILETP